MATVGVLALLHAAAGQWRQEAGVLGDLIADLDDRGSLDRQRIVDYDLRAEHARALRLSGAKKRARQEVAEFLRSDPLSCGGRREARRMHRAER